MMTGSLGAGAERPEAATFGRYQVFARLGRGGMAEVFLAVSRGPVGFNKLVVIKRLRAAMADQPGMVTMFLDEARLAARLSHPNIVHTFEVGEHDGSFFIVMEYLEGQSLNRLLRSPGARTAVTEAMWLRMAADALAGLHHAHELKDYDGTALNIVHRDVSPHNIFVGYSGQVKIVDFGIAKTALNSQHTETGVLKGKLSYMAPEQVSGSVDRRSDVFAMGATLWELLSGQKLFQGEAAVVLNKLVSQPIPHLSSVLPHCRPELDALVARSLERDPSRRFQTAEEMRDAIEEYLRKTGQVVREAGIGAAITNLFRDVKESAERQIHQHLAVTPPSAPVLALLNETHSSLPEIVSVSQTPSHMKVRVADGAMKLVAYGIPSTVPPPNGAPSDVPSDVAPNTERAAGPPTEPDPMPSRLLFALRQRPLVWVGGLAGLALLLSLPVLYAFRGPGASPTAKAREGVVRAAERSRSDSAPTDPALRVTLGDRAVAPPQPTTGEQAAADSVLGPAEFEVAQGPEIVASPPNGANRGSHRRTHESVVRHSGAPTVRAAPKSTPAATSITPGARRGEAQPPPAAPAIRVKVIEDEDPTKSVRILSD